MAAAIGWTPQRMPGRMERDHPRMGGSGPMGHRRGAIWTERLLLGLILFSLAGTLNLLVAIDRRAAAEGRPRPFWETPYRSRQTADQFRRRPANPAPRREPRPPTDSRTAAGPPAEDPTQKAISSLAAATDERNRGRQAADRARDRDPSGYRSAVAESGRGNGGRCSFASRSPGITLTPRNSSAMPTLSTPSATCSNTSASHQGRPRQGKQAVRLRRAPLQGP